MIDGEVEGLKIALYWKKWYAIFLKLDRKNMYLIAVVMTLLTLLSGCYDFSPQGEDLRTVPITNNPHVHPGYERPVSVPQMQY